MKIWSKRRSKIPLAKDDKTYSSHLYQLPAKDFHDEGEKPKDDKQRGDCNDGDLLGMVSHPKTRGSHYALNCCGIRERSFLKKIFVKDLS